MTSYLDITAHYRQYEKTQQNLRASLGNLFISKESKLTPLKAAFFCLKCLIGYTRYGRSGRAASRWPLTLLDGFPSLVRSATITLGK